MSLFDRCPTCDSIEVELDCVSNNYYCYECGDVWLYEPTQAYSTDDDHNDDEYQTAYEDLPLLRLSPGDSV